VGLGKLGRQTHYGRWASIYYQLWGQSGRLGTKLINSAMTLMTKLHLGKRFIFYTFKHCANQIYRNSGKIGFNIQ